MGDEDRLISFERRLEKLDERLDRLVDATTSLTGNVTKMETQIESLTKLLEERLHHHEKETESRLDSHADRLAVMGSKLKVAEDNINRVFLDVRKLKEAPAEAAKLRMDRIFDTVWKIIVIVVAAAVMVYLGFK